MPSKLRFAYPGAIYLVLNGGGQRGDIFKGGSDRHILLSCFNQARPRLGNSEGRADQRATKRLGYIYAK